MTFDNLLEPSSLTRLAVGTGEVTWSDSSRNEVRCVCVSASIEEAVFLGTIRLRA